jgi:hypothetical protein
LALPRPNPEVLPLTPVDAADVNAAGVGSADIIATLVPDEGIAGRFCKRKHICLRVCLKSTILHTFTNPILRTNQYPMTNPFTIYAKGALQVNFGTMFA